MKTYYGTKVRMTQVWSKTGARMPATVIKTEPMVVTQKKTTAEDGYNAVQVAIGTRRPTTLTKAVAKHLSKSGVSARYLRELDAAEMAEVAVGDKIASKQVLSLGDIVMVQGASKGRGFSGVMKRHGFKGGPKTHGQSDRWRAPGSIGQGTSPGRIHKGKRMAGHYGLETFTIKNLQIIKVDDATNEIWVNGPVPGGRNELVQITVSKKGTFAGLHLDDTATEAVVAEVKE